MKRLSAEEARLVRHPRVESCAVARRVTRDGGERTVAWVVLRAPAESDELSAWVAGAAGCGSLDDVVEVACLPLDGNGGIDLAALAAVPVLDDRVAAAWQDRAGPDTPAVVIRRPWSPVRERLHVEQVAGEARRPTAEPPVAEPAADLKSDTPAGDAAPSRSVGGPIDPDPDRPATLVAMLERAAREHGTHGVRYLDREGVAGEQTYPELQDDALAVLGGLRDLGLVPGQPVLLQLEDNRDFLTCFWGCLLGGFVPVPVAVAPSYAEPNAVAEKLHNAWELLGQPWIVAGAGQRAAVESAGPALFDAAFRVASIDDLADAAPADPHAPAPDDLALMMLTSGSTGRPKAVTLSHANLIARSAGSVQLNEWTADDVSVNWMPLDHVAGILYFHLRDVYTGAHQIHAPTELVLEDPLRWIDWLDRYRATVTFAPNFAFGLVNDQASAIAGRSWDLSSVRYVLNGAEAIVARTARRFMQLLIPFGLSPEAMTPAWGMSETSSGVTYGDRFTLDRVTDEDPFVEVGRPVPGFEMRIVDEADRVVPEGTVGRLQVGGRTITAGYFRPEGLNRDDFTADGWFNTGDLGKIVDGRMTITGREKDVIIINSVNYYAHEIEGVIEELDGIETSFTAACAVREPGATTDRLAVFFHAPGLDDAALSALIAEIRRNVLRRVGIAVDHLVPVERDDIPKTSIGKIQRPQLSAEFAAGRFDAALQRVELLTGGDRTMPAWFWRRTWRPLDATEAVGEPVPTLWLLADGDLPVEAGAADLVVHAADTFATEADRRFRVRPSMREDLERVLATLDEPPARVVACGWRSSDRDAAASHLAALQALIQANPTGLPVRWLTFAAGTCPLPGGAAPHAGNAAVPGLLRSARLEANWLEVRHVDLEGDPARDRRSIACELGATDREEETAWRRGRRFVPRFSAIDLARIETGVGPLPEGGTALITGGLGGIGGKLAARLVERRAARVLLVGRRAERALEADDAQRLATLQAAGPVRYASLDVADGPALSEAVGEALRAFATERLDAVFHLAGTFEECTLDRETAAGLESALRPKLGGARAIETLLDIHPEAFVVAGSSVNAAFGGWGVGAYAAANAALEAWSAADRVRRPGRGACLAFSLWDEVGMSRGYAMKDLTRTRGFDVIPAEHGLASLDGALARGSDAWWIGLDGSNRHVRRRQVGGDLRVEVLAGVVEGAGGEAGLPDGAAAVTDTYGTCVPCEWTAMESLPRRADGTIDPTVLAARLEGTATELVEPEGELERQVAAIWSEVLRRERISVEDNFFDLGGNSLLLAQVSGKIREALAREVSMTDLFQHPTVRAVAGLLAGAASGDDAAAAAGRERGARRRDRIRRRRRPAGRS